MKTKKEKREYFISRYNPCTEEQRAKVAYYRNRVRLMLFRRKLEQLENET